MDESAADRLRRRLRSELTRALRSRDSAAVSALRSLIATVDNAEAVDTDAVRIAGASEEIAGAVKGLGAGDVPRRVLTEARVRDLVTREITERRDAAADYEAAGETERAQRLRAEADALEPFQDA